MRWTGAGAPSWWACATGALVTTGPCWTACPWPRRPDEASASWADGVFRLPRNALARRKAMGYPRGMPVSPRDIACEPPWAPGNGQPGPPGSVPRPRSQEPFRCGNLTAPCSATRRKDCPLCGSAAGAGPSGGTCGSSRPAHTNMRTALDQLLAACPPFRNGLPARAHPNLAHMQRSVRKTLKSREAYEIVPGRDRGNVQAPARVAATPKDRQRRPLTSGTYSVVD